MLVSVPARLCRLIYRSRDVDGLGGRDGRGPGLAALAEDAARRNAGRGLGGALLWIDGEFVQVLEGPLDALEQTFEAICRDRRHRNLRLVDFAPASERAFPDWAMLLADPVAEDSPATDPLRRALSSEQRAGVVIEAILVRVRAPQAASMVRVPLR